jgi:choline dehydrogenase-like flavoprotein
MPSADFVVVGSGPSGTFAARQLRGRDVLVLDVGHRGQPGGLTANLYDVRQAPPSGVNAFDELIGSRFESLHNVFHSYTSPKLKGPRMRFVTRGAAEWSPVASGDVDHVISLAAGGMANVWGAGLYPFSDDDLAGYPIGLAELLPYYDAVVAHVGVSGADDDLSQFFGPARGLQPPVELPAIGRDILARYERRRAGLNREGLYIGRPRLAVLTQSHDGRPAYKYEALEFFRPNDPAVYNPAYTLDAMIRAGEVRYRDGVLVERYVETGDFVTVHARECATGEALTFTGRRLILAAGTLNTSRIVLRSSEDYTSELPLLDTPLTYIPLVDPLRVGGALDKFAYSAAMLSAVYKGQHARRTLQVTLYAVLGTLRSDYLFDFPLSIRGNLAAAKYLTPALVIAQVTYPDEHASIRLRLRDDGALELRGTGASRPDVEPHLLRLFRRIGYFGAVSLCRRLKPGSSYRFAGTLPMTESPASRYETDRTGLLHGTRAVYVADAATFSPLPAKNHSFTMMANAMRVADHAGRAP